MTMKIITKQLSVNMHSDRKTLIDRQNIQYANRPNSEIGISTQNTMDNDWKQTRTANPSTISSLCTDGINIEKQRYIF